LQPVDSIEVYFLKIEFSHSLALRLTASSVRSCLAPASGSR
jgi:hypothetical protein